MHNIQIRGVISPDKKFRIIRNTKQGENSRMNMKGKICYAFLRSELVDMMLELGMSEPEETSTKAEICDSIQNHMQKQGMLDRKYGIISPDGTFRVCRNEPNLEGNARMVQKGKVCSVWTKSQLIDLMMELGMPEPEGTATKDEIIASLQNHMEKAGRLVRV